MRLSTQNKALKFWIPGRVVPKARPRFNGSQAYLPSGYRGWKSAAYLEVLSQLTNQIKTLPIHRAAVEMQVVGSHKGDLDNIAGSVLDVLVEAEVLIDDRLSCVSRLVIEHEPTGERGVWVEISALD